MLDLSPTKMRRALAFGVSAILIAASVVIMPSVTAHATVQLSYYVAPDGDDDNPGTMSQPFATVDRARQEVAENNSDMTGDIVVYLRGGTYAQPETLTFGEADSATNGHQVIYRAFDDEQPVISGGIPVTGWTEVDAVNHIYRAPVPAGFDTRELYVNGARATRARGEISPSGFGVTSSGFTFNVPTNSKYANLAAWGNLGDVHIAFKGHPWQFHECGVSSATAGPNPSDASKIQGSIVMYADCFNVAQNRNAILWVENARELLDQSREWYLDQTADYLYYKPGDGEDLSSASVIAPKLERLVTVEGTDATHLAKGLAFIGLTFAHATWLRPNSVLGYADLQGGSYYDPSMPAPPTNISARLPAGAVSITFADGVDIQDGTITHMGGIALTSVDSANITVYGNRFTSLSHGGININRTNGFEVSNNYFTQVGLEYHDAMPVNVGDSTGAIDHNEISNVPYSGIGRYGTGAVKIRNNYIHDYMERIVDGGAIYTNSTNPTNDDPSTPTVREGDEISGNYGLWQGADFAGIYFDDGSAEEYAHDNVLSWVSYGLLIKGSAHRIENNYMSAGMRVMSCSGCTIGTNPLVSGGNWPAAAVAIVQGAGLEPAYRHLLEDGQQRVPRAHMTATVTSTYSESYVGANAIDGADHTLWASASGTALPQSITLSLGDIYPVTGIEVMPRQQLNPGGNITQYKIHASSDGVTYTQVAAGTWADDWLRKTTKLAVPTEASYIKVEVLAGNGGIASAASIDVLYRSSTDVGNWQFDETSGATATDISGAGNDASLSGGGSWVPGIVRNGRMFNGVDSYAEVQHEPESSDYTVGMWIKPLSKSAQNIWARTSAAGTATDWSEQLRINSEGKFEAFVDDGAGKTVTGSTVVNPNTWYHVAMTATDGGQLKLYVNGTAEGTAVAIGTMWSGGDRYRLGSSSGGSFGWLHAIVDRVRLYERVLSAADIGLMYAVTPTALTGHWKLDETSGATAADASRRHADGTLLGGATRATGVLANGVSFNGTSAYVDLPNSGSSAAVTASVWVKLTTTSAQNFLVRTSSAGALAAASHQLRLGSNGVFEAMMFDGSAKRVVGTTRAQAGQWYHLAMTAQSNGQLKLYVNGLPEGTPVNVGALWANGDRYWLGSNSAGGFGWFNGIADDVQVFDEALSPARIGNLANPSTDGLSGYWPFDEGTGASAEDASGFFNNAAFSGGAIWATGHSRSSLKLNGSDALATIPALVDPTALSVSLWVKPSSTAKQNVWVRTSSAGPSTDWSHQVRIGAGGTFEAVMKDGGVKTVTGTTALQAGRWYLVGMTAANDGQLKLYVNGAEEGTAASIGSMWTGGDQYRIGAATGGGSGWLNGAVDDVRLSAYVMSDAEMSRLYATSPTNVARDATITASTQFDARYLATNVVDQVVGVHGSGEWASTELNPWIRYEWSTPQTINQAVFFDRVNTVAWTTGGTLEFSDGSIVTFRGVPNDGSSSVLAFTPRTVTWVKFTVAGTGNTNGLSEMQLLDGAQPTPLNLAREAAVTASTQYSAPYAPIYATDDISGVTGAGEWASLNEVNPSLTLTWGQPRTFNTVVLYDRPGSSWTQSGTLTFSDGSTWPVSGIPNDGKPFTVSFPTKTVSSVVFTATGTGGALGLAEIQVFNIPGAKVNVAPIAQLTASTEYSAAYAKSKAVDGFQVDGWASTQLDPTFSLEWTQAQTISRVVLSDRPGWNTNINSGTLTFSEGPPLTVTGIPADGTPLIVDFSPRSVTSVTFTVTGGTGSNVGLSEIQVY